MLYLALAMSCLDSAPKPTTPVFDVTDWVQLWETEPHSFVRNSSALSNAEKLLLVRSIIRNPNLTRMPLLCSILSKKDQHYCNEMLNRSHLWEVSIPSKDIEVQLNINERICPTNDEWCLIRTSTTLITNGETGPSIELCERIPTQIGLEECFFQIAEVSSSIDSITIGDSFSLCQRTPNFQEHCQAHVLEGIAKSLQPTTIIREELSHWVKSNTPIIQEPMEYWSSLRAMHNPNDQSIPMTHLHSAQTIAYLAEEQQSPRSLDEWVRMFNLRRETSKSFQPIKLSMPIINYWVDSQTTNLYYLSLETRPSSAQIETDIRLAMLAALIQLQFPVQQIPINSLSEVERWMLSRSSPTNKEKTQNRQ